MAREVSQQFAETTCGRDVLQASMTSLLKYYTRWGGAGARGAVGGVGYDVCG